MCIQAWTALPQRSMLRQTGSLSLTYPCPAGSIWVQRKGSPPWQSPTGAFRKQSLTPCDPQTIWRLELCRFKPQVLLHYAFAGFGAGDASQAPKFVGQGLGLRNTAAGFNFQSRGFEDVGFSADYFLGLSFGLCCPHLF